MKILFALQIPPPINGSSMVGAIVKEIFETDNITKSNFINISLSENSNRIGVFELNKIFKIFKINFLIFYHLLKTRPDIIYFAPTVSGIGFLKDLLSIFIIKMFKRKSTKIFYHLHNRGVSINSNFIYSYFYKLFFKSTYVLLLSEKLYYDIKNYVEYENVYIIPNGSFDSRIISKKEFAHKEKSTLTIGFLSNLIISKGILLLLDSMVLLKNQGYDFKCIVAGNDADLSTEQLLNEIKKRKLVDNLEFIGSVNGKNKEIFYENLDVFIFPSFYSFECLPMVLIEATSYGLPIITTDIGATLDTIQNDNGYVISANDISSILNVFKIIYQNPSVLIEMGIRSRQCFEMNFTLNHFRNNLQKILIN